jgi:hypothetical protein
MNVNREMERGLLAALTLKWPGARSAARSGNGSTEDACAPRARSSVMRGRIMVFVTLHQERGIRSAETERV